jgi:hydroxymethylpyrimidine pyrophosphatase-like HAD family hydrolase
VGGELAGGGGLLALDVDGTVVDYDDRLSPAVRAGLDAVRDAGWHVVLATGRALHGVRPVWEVLGLTAGYVVASNGAVAADLATGEPVLVETFEARSTVATIVDEVPDALIAVEVLGVGYRVTGDFPAGELTGSIAVVPHSELLDGPVSRLVVRWPGGDRERIVALAERLGAHGVAYAVGYTAWLDVMPAGVSKASALEVVRRLLDVPPERTVAVGDGENDLEMLRWAARSVAMGQAPDVVRETAGEVTGPVEEDGLAAVLRSLL